MATILLTWELGQGWGHIHRLRVFAERLMQRGHRVVAAIRAHSRGKAALAEAGAVPIPAPHKTLPTIQPIRPATTFAHILHNVGFGDAEELAGLTSSWLKLYEEVSPELIVFDHSPTALLASYGYAARRVLVGTGFSCPPDLYPLPVLRPWAVGDGLSQQRDEEVVLKHINGRLTAWGQPRLDRVSRLYGNVDATFLQTFAELDPFPRRTKPRYFGILPHDVGQVPNWPNSSAKRVFAYLRPFPACQTLLQHLSNSRHATIVCGGDDLHLESASRLASIRFEQQPLDLDQIGSECDLAILNAGHGTIARLLLAGRPLLLFPLQAEQLLHAMRVKQLGAGLVANPAERDRVAAIVRSALSRQSCKDAAQRFADNYRSFDAELRLSEMLVEIEELLRRQA